MSISFHTVRLAALTAAILFVVTGCSSSPTTAAPTARSGGYDAKAAALVPSEVRSKGTIVVGSNAAYPPFESIAADGKTIVGFDADLAHAIGAVLGLKVQQTNVPFDALLAGVAAGRYDMAMSSIGDTKTREQTMDFVTYYWNATAALVAKGNPKRLVANALCGARVGVIRGSLQQTTMLPDQASACANAGKPAPIVDAFQGGPDAQVALTAGRIDAELADAVTLVIAAQSSEGALEVIGPVTRNADPGGVALPKGSPLTNAIHAAIQKLMADGTYAKIIAKWSLQKIAIDSSVINGARS